MDGLGPLAFSPDALASSTISLASFSESSVFFALFALLDDFTLSWRETFFFTPCGFAGFTCSFLLRKSLFRAVPLIPKPSPSFLRLPLASSENLGAVFSGISARFAISRATTPTSGPGIIQSLSQLHPQWH